MSGSDTPALLRDVGRALYGARFRRELAAELGVTERTVGRWLAGETCPAPGVWRDLLGLVEERAEGLRLVWERLREFSEQVRAGERRPGEPAPS